MGDLIVTETVRLRGFHYLPLLRRHLAGDSGEIETSTPPCHQSACTDQSEILSQYSAEDNSSVVDLVTIVSAADRSYTIIFLPDEPTD